MNTIDELVKEKKQKEHHYEVVIATPSDEDLHKNGFNKNIQTNPEQTAESLIKYGFTNHDKPTLYYFRDLGNDISFNLAINKETLEIERIDVLDENFLQPYDYQQILIDNKQHPFAKKIYYKVNEILTKLEEDGIITGFVIGMYV